MKRWLLHCQRCGGSEITTGEPVECRICEGTTFHMEHPSRRVPGWEWPGLTPFDLTLLVTMRITWSADEART